MSNRGVYGTYGYGGGYGYGYGRPRSSWRGQKTFFVLGVFLSLLLTFYILVLLGYVEYSYRNYGVLAGLTVAYALTMSDVRIGLVLLYFSFGFSPEFELAGVPNIRAEDFLIPIVVLAWLTQIATHRVKMQQLNVRNPIILLIFIMLLSSLVNINFYSLSMRRSILFLLKEAEYFLILILVLNSISSKRDLKALIFLSLFISITSGLYSYALFRFAGAGGRIGGPAGESANVIGAYYIIHMLIAFGMLFYVQEWRHRLLLVGFLLLMSLPLMFTYSRTSFISFFGALTIVGLLRNRKMLLLALALFILISAFANQAIIVRFSSIAGIFTGSPPSSWIARVSGWELYIDKIINSPFIGHGLGSATLSIDNEYVKVASELGLIGLAVFIWLIVRIAITAHRTCAIAEGNLFKGYALGYFAALVGLLIHCIGTTSFTTIRSMMPFYFLTGLLYVIYNRYTMPDKKVDYELSKYQYALISDEDKKQLVAEQLEMRNDIEDPSAPPVPV